MKKYLLIGLLVFLPFFAKAETQVFGFMNGQFYDIKGTLKYACLMDGSCYEYETEKMTTLAKILGLSATIPQTIVVSDGLPTPPQVIYVPVPVPVPVPVASLESTPSPTPAPASSSTSTPTVDPEWFSTHCHMGGGRKIDPACNF